MNCANCGAAMRRDFSQDCLVCDFCRTVRVPTLNNEGVRVFPQRSGKTCPVCNYDLNDASIAGCAAEYCQSCGGVLMQVEAFLVAQSSLRLIAGKPLILPRRSSPAELSRSLRCPACRQLMDTHFYGGSGNVVIDNCHLCEVNWLDRGELQRIVQSPDPPLLEDFTWNPTIGFKT